MSSWFKIGLFVAIFSTVLYTSLTVFTVTGLAHVRKMYNKPKMNVDPDVLRDENRIKFGEIVKVTTLWTIIVELIIYIIMMILSVLLTFGFKKERHAFILPWLCVAGIIIVMALFHLYFTRAYTGDFKDILDLVVMGLQTVMWFPIFTCYKKMLPSRSNGKVRNSAFSKVGFSSWAKTRS